MSPAPTRTASGIELPRCDGELDAGPCDAVLLGTGVAALAPELLGPGVAPLAPGLLSRAPLNSSTATTTATPAMTTVTRSRDSKRFGTIGSRYHRDRAALLAPSTPADTGLYAGGMVP
jgi:hypothetical protein